MTMRTNFLLATVLAYTLTACDGEKPKETAQEKPEKEAPKEEKQPEVPKTEELSEEAKKLAKKWAFKSFTHTDGRKEDATKDKQVMNLKADGTFEKTQAEKVISSGTWNVKDKTLITTSTKGEIEKAPIKESTDKRLVTSSDEGKMTEIYESIE